MPTARTKKTSTKSTKPKNVVIGFCGSKKMTAKAIAASLDDVIAANAKAKYTFVFPVSSAFMNENLAAIVDYAGGKGVEIHAVHTDADKRVRKNNVKGIIADATEAFAVKNVPLKLVNVLVKAKDSGADTRLFVLYDENDESAGAILDKAFDKGIDMFNLSSGLEKLEADEEEEEDEEDDDNEETSDDEEEEETEDDDDDEEAASDDDDEEDDEEASDDEEDEEDEEEEDDDDEEEAVPAKSKSKTAGSKAAVGTGLIEEIVAAVIARLGEICTAAVAE